ncbi:MAG: DUF3108 domain-containing protein [Bacteroidota bacterium]
MTIRMILFCFLCLHCITPALLFAGDRGRTELPFKSLFDRREELVYSVSWMSINIGTITLTITPDTGSGGPFTAAVFIDSRQGLPFANVHAVFKGNLDSSGSPIRFFGYDQMELDRWSVHMYTYSKERDRLFAKKGEAKRPDTDQLSVAESDTLMIDRLTQDGLSIFYFARKQLNSLDTFSVKTVVHGSVGTTILNCYGKQTEIDIGAIDQSISVIEMDGMAKFKGVFGLTGEFKGWFSNDNAHIPIRAKLGVILGNVNLELIHWKREGWTPPRYNNLYTR